MALLVWDGGLDLVPHLSYFVIGWLRTGDKSQSFNLNQTGNLLEEDTCGALVNEDEPLEQDKKPKPKKTTGKMLRYNRKNNQM